MDVETNSTLKHAGVNEYGDHGRVARRFFKHPDCVNAYQNYFCWINFPRCDVEKDLTLPTCRSACENYFISCGYATDLWRCGKSKWFNGYFPESNMTNLKGNTTYMRDYFPGQPFRQNKYTHLPTPHPTSQHGQELAICTPAITGSGSRTDILSMSVSLLALMVISSSFYFI
mmetsp:Transcript_9687/g.14449  ORF Transcript_9687/g.14449 Transcript_9687/m.14449 type:complete len:172 (+) Transcript_9687:304-819(+)